MKPLFVALFIARIVSAQSSGDVRDVRVIRTTDQEPRAALLGQPSIALWKEKHLVVAYQKGIAGKGDMGSIDACVSSNDGGSRCSVRLASHSTNQSNVTHSSSKIRAVAAAARI